MDIPKRYTSLFILIVFIATELSHADTSYNISVANVTLPYYCKSKDDDFGEKSLQPAGSWSFSFKPWLFGKSLFFCFFFALPNGRWDQLTPLLLSSLRPCHRDSAGDDWCQNCVWKIRLAGLCRLNREKQFDTPSVSF
ncbi:hypothetical protein N665_2755s0003 [Sinapis alba]|nr:hypothetical protein N665_2755s0003 [Sinapis alba]